MYCSECGKQAAGKFCCHCGVALQAGPVDLPPPGDWEESLDYHRILRVPEVRARVDAATAEAERGFSGPRLLKLIDQAATPLTGGVSSLALSKIAQPLTAKLGLRTCKDRTEMIALPPGRVLANIAVGLARAGYGDVEVKQFPDTCQFTVTLPADLRSMEGTLSITVSGSSAGTLVTAEALIEGVWYDWGRCKRQLDDLFGAAKVAA
jgi:hypothetical protein